MLETIADLFLTVFSVFATLIGATGVAISFYQWVAADIFGRPLKVNGVDGPIDWPQRGFLALFVALSGGLTALGAWLFSADWVAPAYVSLLTSIPLWAFGLFVLLIWLFVTWLLNRSAGWPELRRSFPRPAGDSLFSEKLKWAVMGKGVTCKNVITIAAYDAGVGIDQSRLFGLFTGPVLVPWDQLTGDAVEGAAPDLIRLRFGELEKAALILPLDCWQMIERHRPADSP